MHNFVAAHNALFAFLSLMKHDGIRCVSLTTKMEIRKIFR